MILIFNILFILFFTLCLNIANNLDDRKHTLLTLLYIGLSVSLVYASCLSRIIFALNRILLMLAISIISGFDIKANNILLSIFFVSYLIIVAIDIYKNYVNRLCVISHIIGSVFIIGVFIYLLNNSELRLFDEIEVFQFDKLIINKNCWFVFAGNKLIYKRGRDYSMRIDNDNNIIFALNKIDQKLL